jgi:predicted amidohydrolase YtcJ
VTARADNDRWLLRGVRVDGDVVDCRIGGGMVLELRPGLESADNERMIAGAGGALLPGLADHHLHLYAAAAARASVDLTGHADLTAVRVPPGTGWLRLIGAGHGVDRSVLDTVFPDRPVRAQHRSGALWTLNSAAIDRLAPALNPEQRSTGQLWRSDAMLRAALAACGEATKPDVRSVGTALARLGVTHVTDATPDLDAASITALDAAVPQHLLSLSGAADGSGPVKLVVADSELPSLTDLTARIGAVHDAGRPVAVHAVSAVALALTLAALTDAGTIPGDRIEHAAVCDDASADRIAALGVTVVTQPAVWARRGTDFLRESPPYERPLLWRFGSLIERGVRIAVSSDAPYGDLNPWHTIRAATTRQPDGLDERVPAHVALATLLTHPLDPAGPATILARDVHQDQPSRGRLRE